MFESICSNVHIVQFFPAYVESCLQRGDIGGEPRLLGTQGLALSSKFVDGNYDGFLFCLQVKDVVLNMPLLGNSTLYNKSNLLSLFLLAFVALGDQSSLRIYKLGDFGSCRNDLLVDLVQTVELRESI